MTDIPFDLETTDTAESAVFEKFYAGYCKAFVLPEEMEDESGFRACLALNHGEAHQLLEARYGSFREVCAIAHDPQDGSFVGGANMIVMPGRDVNGLAVVTANLNYIYVDGLQRGKGHFRAFVELLKAHAAKMFDPSSTRAIVFVEQNDPIAMDNAAYARDTQFTGMDQFDRLRIWTKLGALMVDIDYIQPPLSSDHEAVDTLILSVLGTGEAAALPAALVRHHLACFFGISVLKGQILDDNGIAKQQLAALDAMGRAGTLVRLVDLKPFLATSESPEAIRGRIGVGQKFRSALASGMLTPIASAPS